MLKPDFVPDRPIAFNREFVDIGAGIIGALVLSQSVYWSKRTKDKYGWFYKTSQEWNQEIGVTRWELETARKKLVKLGVLDFKKKGVPCKCHYRVKAAALRKLLYSNDISQFAVIPHTRMMESHKLVGSNPTYLSEVIPQTNTETTHIPIALTTSKDYETGPDQDGMVDMETGEIIPKGVARG